MKTYQKMKAAIVDLSEALDEAVSFNAYAVKASGRKLAYANVYYDERNDLERAAFDGQLNENRITKLEVS